MDIDTIIERENNSEGIYIYVEPFQFKAYGFSAYALTQLFPELTLAEELHEGSGFPVPYLVTTSEFVMENFSDYVKFVDDKYVKANLGELDQSLVQRWIKGYDEYMIEQQLANNKLGSCVLGFFRLAENK